MLLLASAMASLAIGITLRALRGVPYRALAQNAGSAMCNADVWLVGSRAWTHSAVRHTTGRCSRVLVLRLFGRRLVPHVDLLVPGAEHILWLCFHKPKRFLSAKCQPPLLPCLVGAPPLGIALGLGLKRC